MRRLVPVVVACCLIWAGAPDLQAQETGDRVRVRADSANTWTTGKIAALRPDSTFIVQRSFQVDTFAVDSVARADLWEPRNPALTLLGSTAGGAVGWWAGQATSEGVEAGASDLAIGAGIGLAGGLVVWALDPGDWKAWIEP